MRKLMLLAAVLVLAAGCNSEDATTKQMKAALVDGVKANFTEVADFTVSSFEVKEQVLFKNELDRRIALMDTKLRAEEKMIQKYQMQGKYDNYKKHLDAMNRTQAILEDLALYKETNLSKADSVIYYVVRFTGDGRTADKAKIAPTTKLATVSPDFKVYSIQPDGGNAYKSMGVALPGYLDLLQSHHAEQSAE